MKTVNLVVSIFGIMFFIVSFIMMAISPKYLISLVLFFAGICCMCVCAMAVEHIQRSTHIKRKISNRNIGILDN
jgi:hypothetical protein